MTMKKYIKPSFEVVKLESSDIMLASNESAVKFAPLSDVDKNGDTSAIFDASYWSNK